MPRPSITTVYEDFIWLNEEVELAERLYGTPPKTFGGNSERMIKLLAAYEKTGWHSADRMKKLQKTLLRINKELGTLTPKVKGNIENLHRGAIEAAHQSAILGGPTFILNKGATAERIASFNSTEEHPLSPFFCIADYDIVQNELTHMRTPLMGSGGTLMSIPIPEGFEYSPVSVIPLPEYSWFEQVEEDIRSGYRPMFKNLEGNTRFLFEERLETSLMIIRSAFVNTKTLGAWATRILGHLFNIQGNLGLPLLPASDKEIRELWALGMELLLQKDNRLKLIEIHGQATELIQNRGYETGIGSRSDEYVPFYYECTSESCNRSRTELSYIDKGTQALLQGRCPSCGDILEIEVDAFAPDLSDVCHDLSPRVDTRQMIIDTSLPILAHAGGPGETAYYAQVIPVAKELNYPFPLYVKYPRIYYNTPWNESLAKELKEKEHPVLHNGEMFKPLGKVSRFRGKDRIDDMNEQLHQLASIIKDTHGILNASLKQLTTRIETDPSEDNLQEKVDLERYLSWVYGQYAEGKMS
ncbi:MAG: bacillithiol biosynthesis BshC, partial [Candidatus Thorarchaeota archaeon]